MDAQESGVEGMILIVDDERTFKNFPENDPNVRYARNSIQAIAWMTLYDFDIIYLDHDLGGDDTAMNVVDWMNENVFHGVDLGITMIYVHSMNPVGAANVVRALERNFNVARISLPDTV